MIDELVNLLPNFPGQANRGRCFLHIVNLVAKTLLKQFDVPKKDVSAALDAAERELLELAAGIDLEEMATVAERAMDKNDDDDVDGWVDETQSLSADENEEMQKKNQPVRLMLVKVMNSHKTRCRANSRLFYSFGNSLSRSFIPPQRSCLHGNDTLMSSSSRYELCREMCPPVGTQPLTC
jgi:hypothetical protein